ncbi:hypothetical protein I4U23_010370 [Adineta vaga]|nr:hypothetical protein I4U23_010370 [Adineta vaga]
MSTTSETYECPACTLVQSIKRPSCDACETNNPYFVSDTFEADAALAVSLYDAPADNNVVECSECHYINIGSNIQLCDGCKKSPYNIGNQLRQILGNLNLNLLNNVADDNDDDDENNNDDLLFDDNFMQVESKAPTIVEKGMDDDELLPYYHRYILLMRDEQRNKQTLKEENLHQYITELFHSLQYKNDQSDGQLRFPVCQICYVEDVPMVTMKNCGHRVLCTNCFHQYLTTRIDGGDILPWIPCPAESCSVLCHADNIAQDGRLTYSELLTFITKFMLKKLSRNENFITCIHCQKGGFLQMGPSKKQTVICQICNKRQVIEKGFEGDLDDDFKEMIKSGQLRECPTCRHWTLKEKGLCNIIECSKCGIWWNWNTREQGHNGSDLKQRARMNGTLWEPGELRYQQELERDNPEEFKALLERNGIKYNPNYVRGSWDD